MNLQYLVFNNENIPMPVSYSVDLSDVEADSSGVTEAGTTQMYIDEYQVKQVSDTSYGSFWEVSFTMKEF